MPLLLEARLAPHAPAILEEVNGRGCGSLRDWGASLSLSSERLVLVSPHGDGPGVYLSSSGDLGGSGIRSVGVETAADPDLTARIAEGWGVPALETTLDHGAIVPLLLTGWDGPVVAISLAGAESESVEKLAGVLDEVLDDRTALLVSAHGSAALSYGGPLTARDEGRRLQTAIDDALRAGFGELLEVPEELWASGGSCSRRSFELLAHLLPARRLDVAVAIEPFGVGYRAGSLAP